MEEHLVTFICKCLIKSSQQPCEVDATIIIIFQHPPYTHTQIEGKRS